MQHAAAPSHAEPAAGSQHPPAAFSLQEAAMVLGISLNTLRRRIDAGQVRAERVERPQGHVWRVYLDDVQHAEQHIEQRAEADGQRSGSTLHQDAASTLPQPADGLLRAEAMAAYTRAVLEPLVAALERSQARVSELERENGGLVKDNGTLAGRLAAQKRLREAAMARAAELEARFEAATRTPDPEPAPAPFPEPIPPAPNVGPSRRPRRVPKWRRWLRQVVLGE